VVSAVCNLLGIAPAANCWPACLAPAAHAAAAARA
jgi:hypothetical protein